MPQSVEADQHERIQPKVDTGEFTARRSAGTLWHSRPTNDIDES